MARRSHRTAAGAVLARRGWAALTRAGLTRGALALASLALAGPALVACEGAPERLVTSQPSHGHDLPVSVPVAVTGLDEPAGPILNADGGEVPKGVYTAPVTTTGLDEPAPSGAS